MGAFFFSLRLFICKLNSHIKDLDLKNNNDKEHGQTRSIPDELKITIKSANNFYLPLGSSSTQVQMFHWTSTCYSWQGKRAQALWFRLAKCWILYCGTKNFGNIYIVCLWLFDLHGFWTLCFHLLNSIPKIEMLMWHLLGVLLHFPTSWYPGRSNEIFV